jgi:serine/threonine protein kinase
MSAQPDSLPADATATSPAPTFAALVPAPEDSRTDAPPSPGQRLGDFQLLRVLGTGSFARVFLARQISLDRLVALKVTANEGSEARTLARLEHEHIVQVFSESVVLDQRLMCMQYVAGTTLERVLHFLKGRPRHEWNGRAILEGIDCAARRSSQPAALNPAALRGRGRLAQDDLVQAVCRLGAQLARALDHAHRRGILHRDIKPANILVSQYGRPLLMDFNLSSQANAAADGPRHLGGTPAYMAPEHLDAFNPEGHTPPEAVDRRSDTYALGLVLFEMLTGELPFPLPLTSTTLSARENGGGEGTASLGETLRLMAAARSLPVRPPRQLNPDVPACLDHVVRRCLEPDPRRRYQTAGELARALEGCGELRRSQRKLPTPGPLGRAAGRHPFLMLAVLTLLPHVLGTVVNICYNTLRIVNGLTEAQQHAFSWLVVGYNLLMYPACLAILVGLLAPAWRTLRDLERGRTGNARQLADVRRGVLRWPLWAVALSCLGWLPGGIVFPLAIGWCAGPVGGEVFGHFLLSFTVSGLIALTYSYFAVQFMVLRVFYCRLWADGQGFGPAARAEIGSLGSRLRRFQLLAGTIPLVGAVLLIGVGPEISGERTFRVLVAALLVLGMAGFGVATLVHHVLAQTLAVLTRRERQF